jgi:Spy/CpxP family protein refolding chaperone
MLFAAVLLPAAAWAQHGHAPAPKSPAPVSPAPAPGEPDAGEEAGLDEDGFAFLDEGEDWFGGDGGEAMADGPIGHGGPGGMAMHGGRGMARHHGPGMGRGVRGRGHGGGLAWRFARLDLTDAQREKLRDLHEAAMRKNVQRRADAQLARLDLHKAMRAENPNSAGVNTQIDKLARLHAEGMKAHFDTYLQARALLTPEQRKQLHQAPGAMRGRAGEPGGGSAK